MDGQIELKPDVIAALKTCPLSGISLADIQQNETLKESNERIKNRLRILTIPPMFTTVRVDINEISAETAMKEISHKLDMQTESRGLKKFEIFQHEQFNDCFLLKNRGPIKVEQLSSEVIVDLACGMAVLRGANVFKQGIMGAPVGLEHGTKVSVYADLESKCLKGSTCKYEGRKLHVGNGHMQVSRSQLFAHNGADQRGIGVLMTEPLFEAPCLSELNDLPWLSSQNLPSIACVHALNPQPGESVLDMCAAPGGKTAHIAALMNYKGSVIALEKSGQRAEKMKQLGIRNVHVYKFDATKCLSKDPAASTSTPPFSAASFDRVLVDAPCSALGQRPCLANKISLNQLKSFPVIQHKLLMAAADLVKPGGSIVYSTCTITMEENEKQVARLLEKRSDLMLVAPEHKLASAGDEGCGLTESQRLMVERFDPGVLLTQASRANMHNIDTIGFFIAKFVKILQPRENT